MSHLHDQLYDALADRERRQMLFRLVKETPQTGSPVDPDSPPDTVETSELGRIEHQHTHLPKLDDYGFIEWTPDANRIEPGSRFDEIRPVLEALASHHRLPTNQ